jgi:hypothetical protein
MYRLIRKLAETIGYGAPIKAAIASIPQIYIIGRRLSGGTVDFLYNPSPTAWIPGNVVEQTTTGALFPGTTASLVGSRLKIGDRLDSVMHRTTGRRLPARGYLNYALPAVGGTLLWDGTMSILRMLGVEGAEKPQLMPFDAAVAMTISAGMAYAIDYFGKFRWTEKI